MSLLPVAEAQARLLALVTPLPTETVPLVEATGRWAAEDVVARRTQPAADLSMMTVMRSASPICRGRGG